MNGVVNMNTAKKLINDIVDIIPDDKAVKLLSFAKYLKDEQEPELLLTVEEEQELQYLLDNDERVDGENILKGILGGNYA